MLQAPPREYWQHLLAADVIIAAADGMYAALKQNSFGWALARLSDQMDDEDFHRMKRELDEATSLMGLMMRKRIKFGLTAPVATERPHD